MTDTASAIRSAVLSYLADHPDALTDEEEARIREGEALIDQDDNLRIGSWLLEDRQGTPVLTRERQGQLSRLTVIYLEKSGDGDWRVTDVGEEHYSFG